MIHFEITFNFSYRN